MYKCNGLLRIHDQYEGSTAKVAKITVKVNIVFSFSVRSNAIVSANAIATKTL
jgi:hypothetical protein